MYELWDSVTKNMIDCYANATQGEAAIMQTVSESGMNALQDLVLVQEDEHEESHLVAEGEAILVAIKRLRSDEIAKPNPPAMPGRRAG